MTKSICSLLLVSMFSCGGVIEYYSEIHPATPPDTLTSQQGSKISENIASAKELTGQSLWVSAEQQYLKTLKLLDSLDLDTTSKYRYKADILLRLSALHVTFSGEYSLAVDQIIRSLAIAELMHDTLIMIRATKLLGYVSGKMGNRESYLRYTEKAVELATIKKDTFNLIQALNDKATLMYSVYGDFDSALELFEEAYRLATLTGEEYMQVCITNDIGNTWVIRKNHEKALPFFLHAYEVFLDQKRFRELCIVCSNAGDCYMNLNDLQNAQKFFETGIGFAEKYSIRNEQRLLYGQLSELYKKKGDYRKAYDFQAKYITLHDSVFSSEKEKLIAEIKTRYETEKKERENEMLRQSNTISRIQITRQKERFNNSMIVGSVAFAAILVILVMALRRNKERKAINRILEYNNNQITEQKQLLEKALEELSAREKNLAEANAAKDRFFSIIAHDLKNPFSSILGISEFLADSFDELSPSERKEASGRILESSRTVYNLLENLLHWARSQTNQIVPDPEIIAIEDLIIKPLAVFNNAAKAKNIRLETDIRPGLQVYADKGMMETVMRNLLSNAIKFTYPDGRITVESRQHGAKILLTIADSGTGMTHEELESIFRVASGIKKTGTNNEKGTGLGLILSREFVEMNGGTLTAESVPGKGSAFTLTIPAYNHKR